jgi:hypothetical protein
VVIGDSGTATLTAKRLRDGTVRWTAELDIAPEVARTAEHIASVWQGPDVVGVTIWAPASFPPESADIDLRTVVFDASTGRLLWRRQGGTQGAVQGGGLMMYRPFSGPPEGAEYTVVDIRTGAVRRTFVQEDGLLRVMDWFSRSGEVRWMATYQRDGRLTVDDLVTGAEVARADVPPPPPDGRLEIASDLVLVWDTRREVVHMHAYRLTDLAHRWAVPVARDEYASICGPWICLGGAGGTRAIDPADGHQRWSTSDWTFVVQPWRTDLLIVSELPPSPRLSLADARTGAIQRQLEGWTIEGVPDGPDPFLLSRRPVDGAPAWFGLLPADLSAVEWLGVADRTRHCEFAEGYLLCSMIDDRLQVWRINR